MLVFLGFLYRAVVVRRRLFDFLNALELSFLLIRNFDAPIQQVSDDLVANRGDTHVLS